MKIKAWQIVLVVNGEQASDTRYVAHTSGSGWVGGIEILNETISQITIYELPALMNERDNVSLNILSCEVDPNDMF